MRHMRLTTLEDLQKAAGSELGVSEWLLIDQHRVNAFGHAIDDTQWIHCDPERSLHESPFGGAIAHGALTLSLLSCLRERIEGVKIELPSKMGVFYGINKVRFVEPVRVGQRIRLRLKIASAEIVEPGVIQILYEHVVEIEGQRRIALFAETINRQYLR